MDAAPTLAAAYADFLTDLTLEGRSPNTVKTYRHMLRHLAQDDRPITALTPSACRGLVAERMGMARGSVRTYCSALKAFTAYLAAAYPFTRPSFPTPREQPRPHRYVRAARTTRRPLAPSLRTRRSH